MTQRRLMDDIDIDESEVALARAARDGAKLVLTLREIGWHNDHVERIPARLLRVVSMNFLMWRWRSSSTARLSCSTSTLQRRSASSPAAGDRHAAQIL